MRWLSNAVPVLKRQARVSMFPTQEAIPEEGGWKTSKTICKTFVWLGGCLKRICTKEGRTLNQRQGQSKCKASKEGLMKILWWLGCNSRNGPFCMESGLHSGKIMWMSPQKYVQKSQTKLMMENNFSIATLNLCLGLPNKKDMVTECLKNKNIAVCCLQ